MAFDALSKKYSNFLIPKIKVIINGEDITRINGIILSTVSAENSTTEPDKFALIIEDPQSDWISGELFDPNTPVEIKMGYSNILETIVAAQITSTKTTFSPNAKPQIQITGENKTPKNSPSPMNSAPITTLRYGKSLLSFSAQVKAENQNAQTSLIESTMRKAPFTIRCTAQCIGLPEIKPNRIVAMDGLGIKFNKNYVIEKSVHTFENAGYKTAIEGRQIN